MVNHESTGNISEQQDPQLDRIFQALSDSTRRAMLHRLTDGPMTVRQVGAPFPMSAPAISKHVRILEEANLIQREIVGRAHRCRLKHDALLKIESWIHFYNDFWSSSLDSLEKMAKEAKNETAD
jgi:DNA-binding transcriptional ArsR family regulator